MASLPFLPPLLLLFFSSPPLLPRSAWVGIFSLAIGFVDDKITFFVLRAFKGIGAAACIPSALHLIVHIFPREAEMHFALSVFGASGEVANVAGFLLGGVLLLATWRAIFWILAPSAALPRPSRPALCGAVS